MSNTEPKTTRRRRTMTSVTIIAALCGAVGLGSYIYSSPEGSTPFNHSTHHHGKSSDDDTETVTFTNADAGQCVTWDPGNDGLNTNFRVVDCAEPHRFEVSLREDLSTYPTSEFGPSAAQPDLHRQEQLTSELCTGPTQSYLNGRLDPEGRYSISPILPPSRFWSEGDRSMLCGVLTPDANGRAMETTGRAAEQDQSRAFATDTCVRVDGNTTAEVPCTEPHAWQVTAQVNLTENFGDGPWPTTDQQNEYLNGVCTEAARTYLGNDDALYYSTLAPFWTTLQQQSWDAGSRTVNCALTFGSPGGGFATLNGDVRQSFTIDGQPPKEMPERRPLRENQH